MLTTLLLKAFYEYDLQLPSTYEFRIKRTYNTIVNNLIDISVLYCFHFTLFRDRNIWPALADFFETSDVIVTV